MNQCEIWQGSKTKGGYGLRYYQGKVQLAHRVSYKLNKGEIPEGLVVMRSCDNPSCVNPEHLSLGTQSDNRKDCLDKGRA
ncbi:HNH endonuclease signature motif containing protein, partial [Escherichia coli]|uniref:HNH endonuclease signature motif containing protein n=1 Tax=Escherichia coli TaxID=562 RepID=UPI00358F4C75